MASPVPLRTDFDGKNLRGLAKASKDGAQTRRLLALAAIYDGARRRDAAEMADVTPQIIRDWVVRFNERGAEGLIDKKAPGAARKLSEEQRRQLAATVEAGPVPGVHDVQRWRLLDLCRWVWDHFGVAMSEATMSRELKRLGFAKLSARPRHYAQNPEAIDDFKKSSRWRWKRSGSSSLPAHR